LNLNTFIHPERWSSLLPLCRQAIFVFVLLLISAGSLSAQGLFGDSSASALCGGDSKKDTLVEVRPGYLWGMNEIWVRDGDNEQMALFPQLRPFKKEITMNAPALGLLVETFARKNLAIRLQAWAGYPFDHRNEFYLDGVTTAWDTDARYLSVDVAAVYHLCLSPMPYTAGIIAGYRYYNFDYPSESVTPGPAGTLGTFHDHMQIHVPHLGVYYAHGRLLGSVARFDFLASPIAIMTMESERVQGASSMNIEAHALTGIFLDFYTGWARPITRDIYLGFYGRYNYLELSGGATVKSGLPSTRFSLDSRCHLFMTGFTVGYTF
jgi:hypothetical protein